ncbi:MAG: type IX secretion system membrane protein PorP/SprF [Flavobacteriaceae bacterium]|nr:type IX secretion system membrane protein PorP/SprF [Flavobacteriaceae bacterium]
MLFRKNTYLLLFLLATAFSARLQAQDRFIHNLSSLPHFANASYFGFKDPAKIGVVSEFVNAQANNVSQHQYAYATTFFEDYDFQLGLEYMNTKLDNSGYNHSNARLSYIYKLQLENNWYFYPGVTAGFSGYNFDYGNLIFSDQIDILSGQVNTQTSDPIVATDNMGYIDFGASFMAHNDYNMSLGLSIRHLNQPKISSELSERVINLNMLISAQFGYEINLNRYQQGRLPNYSYLYLFQNFSKQGPNTRLDLYQELTMANLVLGINEHVSGLNGANLFQVGFSAGMKLDALDIGFNYSIPMGNSQFATPNAFEIFVNFDLSPYRVRNRKDFSRFY